MELTTEDLESGHSLQKEFTIRSLSSVGRWLFSRPTWLACIIIGIGAASLFVTIATTNLTAQGLYYDELHQATTSFIYVTGRHNVYAGYQIGPVPVLNMPYSGAIKTGIYGMYLRHTGLPFDVASWRLLGVLFVAAGILLFCIIAGRYLSSPGLLLFLLLLITDTTVVLTSRHDWGPTALALLLRLAFVGTWVAAEAVEKRRYVHTAVLGGIVGLAVFEKLSSIVLVLPLLLFILLTPRRRYLRHWTAALVGGAIGATPLIAVNVHSLVNTGSLVSLSAVTGQEHKSIGGLVHYVLDYLTIGSGSIVTRFILGNRVPTPLPVIEGLAVTVLLLLTAAVALRQPRQDRLLQASASLALSYVIVGLGIYVLPENSWLHHWIIGTPFQYGAIVLAASFLTSGKCNDGHPSRTLLRIAFVGALSILLASRLLGAGMLQQSLVRGDSSETWDASLTRIGHFAAQKADDATFIAADWGLAKQVFSLSNGRSDLVHELFWNYGGPEHLQEVLDNSARGKLYLLTAEPSTEVRPDSTEAIIRDVEALPGWQEVPVEPQLGNLSTLSARKFVRIDPLVELRLLSRLPRATVNPPKGNVPDIAVHDVAFGDDRRPALLQHPSSRVSFELQLRQRPELRFGAAIALDCLGIGDGVTFEVEIKDGDTTDTVFKKHLAPYRVSDEASWSEHTVDLSAWQGRRIELTLVTSPGPDDNYACAWALWGQPVIAQYWR